MKRALETEDLLCQDCGADCSPGSEAGPATVATDGKSRCVACHRENEQRLVRLHAAAEDLLDVVRRMLRWGQGIPKELHAAAEAALEKATGSRSAW